MTRGLVRALLLVATGLCAGVMAEERDPVILAARKALAAGQAVAALQLLQQHPTEQVPGVVRLLQAQGLLALGRTQEAAALLELEKPERLELWPEALRGAVSAAAGEAALAGGDLLSARGWLERAVKLRGESVALDRTLVLLAECSERQGDTAAAVRYAHALWRDWPRSQQRARAGVIEARLIAQEQPDQARAILAGVRVSDVSEPVTRLAAAELLCHLLLQSHPGQCLVVAEQDQARLPTAGRLPIYHALALAILDTSAGLRELQALPEHLRDDAAVQSTMSRLQNQPLLADEGAARRIEHARAEIELGRQRAARALLEPLAATNPAALVLLASLSEVPLDGWLNAPAMRDPAAQAAVGIALAKRGNLKQAWLLLQPLVTPAARVPLNLPVAALLYWAGTAAQSCAPERVADLTSALLALEVHGVETGIAWATEAQRREQSAPGTAMEAWARAGEDLPADHPWQPIAIGRAARSLMDGEAGLERACHLLERVDDHATEDQRRCRFLLAQVYERLGQPAQALQVVDALVGSASPEQAQKLERMRERLSR